MWIITDRPGKPRTSGGETDEAHTYGRLRRFFLPKARWISIRKNQQRSSSSTVKTHFGQMKMDPLYIGVLEG